MYGARLGCYTSLFANPSSLSSDPVRMSLVSPKRKNSSSITDSGHLYAKWCLWTQKMPRCEGNGGGAQIARVYKAPLVSVTGP